MRKREALEAELTSLQTAPEPDLSVEKANEILDGFQTVLDSGDDNLLRDLVRSLIDSIVIRGEEIWKLHWKFSAF